MQTNIADKRSSSKSATKCEEVAGRSHASIGILDAGFSVSILLFHWFCFLGGVISMKILDAVLSCFCCSIGSVSGRSHIHEDIGCGVFILLLFHWFCFWEKGLEIRAVHFGAGPKVRVGWKGFGMGMLLSMDSCPCELSRAGRSLGIYTVATWRSCNFISDSIPNPRASALLSCCPFVVSTLTWYTYHRLTPTK